MSLVDSFYEISLYDAQKSVKVCCLHSQICLIIQNMNKLTHFIGLKVNKRTHLYSSQILCVYIYIYIYIYIYVYISYDIYIYII